MPSGIPSEFNDNWGTNYGLDGFGFEMDLGEGLLNRPNPARPTDVGKSGVPEGIMLANQLDLEVPEILTPDISFSEQSFDGFDLGGDAFPHMASYFPKNKPLADFSWMENATQDPDRLPSNDGIDSLSALEALWSAKTDGVNRLPVRDRKDFLSQKLKKPLDDDPFNIDKIAKQNKLASAIMEAMRDSVKMRSLEEIKANLILASQGDLKAIRLPLQQIENDYGLAGNVYLRASAYPGLEKGKWNKEFAKAAKKVKYLIASPGQDVSTVAQMFGLQVVASPIQIPWDLELEMRKPLFASQQRNIDLNLPSFLALKQAFLTPNIGPKSLVQKATEYQKVQPLPSLKEAKESLASFKPSHEEVKTLAQRFAEKADKKALVKIGNWVESRLITKEEFEKIANSQIPPHLLLEKVAAVIALRTNKTASYQGQGEKTGDSELKRWLNSKHNLKIEAQEAHRQFVKLAREKLLQDRLKTFKKIGTMVRANLISPEEYIQLQNSNLSNELLLRKTSELSGRTKSQEYSGFRNENGKLEKVSANQVQDSLKKEGKRQKLEKEKIVQKTARVKIEAKCSAIKMAINQGLSGSRLASLIREVISPSELKIAGEYLNPVLSKTNALGLIPAKPTAQYQGKIYHEHVAQPPSLKFAGAGEIVKYAGHQMNIGKAGELLDQAILGKFGPEAVQNASPQLYQIRSRHEGLAGFNYIDPSVYASEGIKGCAKGAALTKGSNASFVLGMEKCRDCSARNQNGSCMKYKKRIVASIPTDVDVETLRENNIKSSNWSNIPDEDFFRDGNRQLDEEGLNLDLDSGMFIDLSPVRQEREIVF